MTSGSRSRSLLALVLFASGCGSPPPDSQDEDRQLLAGTTRGEGADLTAEQRRWVDSTLARLSLRERIGQMIMVWVVGAYESVDDASFVRLQRWIERDRIGGIVMSYGSPIEVAEKINILQRMAVTPLLTASDLEPGLGRLEGGTFAPSLLAGGSATVWPSSMAIAATGNPAHAFRAGEVIGREARAVGIDLVLAPSVDVSDTRYAPEVLDTRSFGEDPRDVARLGAEFVKGVISAGAAATAKHFPGHGGTGIDSHDALPVLAASRSRLDSVDLIPFRAALDAGAAAVMTAHVAVPSLTGDSTPATLAPKILTELLRDSMRFDGLVITDELGAMKAVKNRYHARESSILAVLAGADVLLDPYDVSASITAIEEAVQRGRIPRARIDDSARRLLELKTRLGANDRAPVDLVRLRRVVGARTHREAARAAAAAALTLIRDSARLVPIAAARRIGLVTFASDADIQAGRHLAARLRRGAAVDTFRSSRLASQAQLDEISAAVRRADRIIVSTHVRTRSCDAGSALAPRVSEWIDSLGRTGKVVLVSFGSPCVIRSLPNVGTFVATFSTGASLEEVTADALLGREPIGGRSPVTLPGFFSRGDGIVRKRQSAGESRH